MTFIIYPSWASEMASFRSLSPTCLRAEVFHPLVHRLVGPVVRTTSQRLTEHELGLQVPCIWGAVQLSELLVDGRVVVLQVGSGALGGQGGPEDELVHAVGVVTPCN